jgi:hypothetical protein
MRKDIKSADEILADNMSINTSDHLDKMQNIREYIRDAMIEYAESVANQRVIEELVRLNASASGTPEHRVVWEWDLDDRIKELKQG